MIPVGFLYIEASHNLYRFYQMQLMEPWAMRRAAIMKKYVFLKGGGRGGGSGSEFHN
jgi:hypothetical protein